MASYRFLSNELPDQNWGDGGVPRLLGFRFNVTQPGYVLDELSYRVVPEGMSVFIVALMQLWDLTASVKVAEVDMLAHPFGAPETWVRFPIPAHTPDTSHNYFVGCYTVGTVAAQGSYVFNTNDVFPIVSGPLLATISAYRNSGTANQPPDGTYTGFYFVDVTATSAGITGTMSAALPTIAPGLHASGLILPPGAITGTMGITAPAARLSLSDRPALSDVESAVLAWLRSRPELDGITFGTRRPARLTGRTPYVTVTRTGGAAALPTWRPGPLLDRCGITLHVWAGPDPAHARKAGAAVLAALFRMRSVVSAGITVVRIGSLSGLAPVPDPGIPDDLHRVTASVMATTR